MNGTVVPNGLATSAFFQWGPTVAYGNVTPGTAVSGGNGSVSISANLSGLKQFSTYHYQLVTSSSGGRAYGADQSFTTLAQPPVVSTLAASAIAETVATLNGTVIPNGARVYFQWGLTPAYGNITPEYLVLGGSTPWSAHLSDLAPGTSYHYRLIAANSGGATYGSDRTFTTTTARPAVNTLSASGVTQTSAGLNGTVNGNGLATTVNFQWGTTTTYANQTPAFVMASGFNTDNVSASLPDLSPSTVYHYRLVAANAAGTTYGQNQTFTTGSLLPTALTLLATAVTGSSANLNGTVNPNGYPVSCNFRWGFTTAYGNTTPTVFPGSGNNYLALSAGLAGLLPATVYHYQLVANNASGSNAGPDLTFTTTGPSPTATTSPAGPGTGASAVLNGAANPNGLSAWTSFRWGSTTNYGNVSTATAIGNGNTPMVASDVLSNLLPGVTYHYAVAANSSGGLAVGADQTFSAAAVAPTVRTLAAVNILQTSAALEGSINPNGWQTSYYFQYGLTAGYGSVTTALQADNGTASRAWSAPVSGLNSYTVYHYRIVASNAGGSAFGDDMTFQTTAPSPQVTTGPPTGITANSAVLNGQVDPINVTATAWFNWGPTRSYGSSTPHTTVTFNSPVSSSITGLTPGTTYHYQVVASSIGGIAMGNDQSFTTGGSNVRMKVVSRGENEVTLSWIATPGQAYKVQYKSSLSEPKWNELTDVTATNSTPTVSDSIQAADHRIYRVVAVQ